MYIPWGYAHQVVSSQTNQLSIAVSFLWERDVAYNAAACAVAPTAAPLPLSLLLPLWWHSGHGVVPLGYPTLDQIRVALISFVHGANDERRAPDAAAFSQWWEGRVGPPASISAAASPSSIPTATSPASIRTAASPAGISPASPTGISITLPSKGPPVGITTAASSLAGISTALPSKAPPVGITTAASSLTGIPTALPSKDELGKASQPQDVAAILDEGAKWRFADAGAAGAALSSSKGDVQQGTTPLGTAPTKDPAEWRVAAAAGAGAALSFSKGDEQRGTTPLGTGDPAERRSTAAGTLGAGLSRAPTSEGGIRHNPTPLVPAPSRDAADRRFSPAGALGSGWFAVLDADGDGALTEAEVIYMFIYISIYRERGSTSTCVSSLSELLS